MSFTKGPWTFDEDDFEVYDEDDKKVASPYEDFDSVEQTAMRANGHLIAAAPSLYAACKVALESLRAWNTIGLPSAATKLAQETYEHSPEIKALVAAINRAEGKEPSR